LILIDALKDLTASTIRMMVTLMMEAVSSAETSVCIYQTTWCNIPEDNHLSSLDAVYYLDTNV
jgi:hypothetical protein